jgi:SsrA-binding protein
MYENGDTISTCKRVEYDYALEPFVYEAGMVLSGDRVKSIRQDGLVLSGSRVWIKSNEAWLHREGEVDIKLLLNRKEISRLEGFVRTGYSLLVDRCYLTEAGKIKIRIRLGKPKKKWDKREAIKERDIKRRDDNA